MYAERAFGKAHGFICAWFLWLCYVSIIPMNAMALSLVMRLAFGDVFMRGFSYAVAGSRIYAGEIALGLSMLLLFGFAASRSVRTAGTIQSVLVIILLLGIFVMMGASFFSSSSSSKNLHPMFSPSGVSPFRQVMSIVVIAPWAYVGFDTVPQYAEEARFPQSFTKPIMDTSILCGCFVYIALTLIAAVGVLSGFSGWPEYLEFLPRMTGIMRMPVFSAAYQLMGKAGLMIISMSAIAGMLSGILGFYMASSRLLYSMSRHGIISSWFGKLNMKSVPKNAVIFCVSVSSFAPFVGRNVLSWLVDMSSIGGAISFGYTSLAAVNFARQEKRVDIMIFGYLGVVLSVMFAVLLLVPLGFGCELSVPSYVMLGVWMMLGLVFYSVDN